MWWQRFLSWQRAFVRTESVRYWATAGLVLLFSIWASPYINASLNLNQLRLSIFQRLTELVGGHYLQPKFSQVVLIEDDDYWDGVLDHRSPTKRDYLANLVRALDGEGATLIALDFDVRLPHEEMPGRPGDYKELDKDYRAETEILIKTIGDVAQRRKIVLSKAMVGPQGAYRAAPDIYQPYGICTKRNPDGTWANPGTPEFPISPRAARNIFCGYIGLPFDILRLPLIVPLKDGGELDSFALAIVRAWSRGIAADIATGDYYGSFIPPEIMKKFAPTISARAVLAREQAASDAVNGKAVLVGSGWHSRAFGDGGDNGLVDLHMTPVGNIGGTALHDNFAEAILSGRVSAALPSWVLDSLEIFFGILAALIFAFYKRIETKLAVLLALVVFLLMMQWIMMAMFYTYFEALVPLVGVAFHSIAARVLEDKA